ncbi:Transmembrane protein [Ceratobasidium theobromae]|uniref:Transmembrane protein n=1 Tax=Ceratobasidium theobromae TaxID=1582974 RepID=A0A5N5QBE2_9AGAM|nr:Transmembrane protein [Ceratobasidium theobromae]
MSRRHSSLFLHVNSDPNPNVNPTLWEHRLRQRRPISRNPFEPEDSSVKDYGTADVVSSPAEEPQALKYDEPQPMNGKENSREEFTSGERPRNQDLEWGDQVPSWLNLFYDLAWTATFSSLTSFHLLFVFLQLVVFGALAATTRGFDVSNYILHSPGSLQLETYDAITITPDRYKAERLTKISLRVITFVLAFSRLLLLIQHLRVAIYAKLTSKSSRFPRRLLIVPTALFVSMGLFFASFAISLRSFSREPHGAKLKFILCGVGLFVEIVAHVVRFQLEISQGIRLRSHGSITGRLNDITTIILGEGINAIAGTFYAIEQAPGFSGPTGSAIVCCGIIVFFLAYLYFEGPAPLKFVRRRAAWVMMHFPWLLSTILLLEGVKNQLLFSSFLDSATFLVSKISDAVDAANDLTQFNDTLRPLLLQGGISFDTEYQSWMNLLRSKLAAAGNQSESALDAVANEATVVWFLRVQLSATLNTYLNFMDNDSISETTYSNIQKYRNDYDFVLEDINSLSQSDSMPHFVEILGDMLKPSADNGRYIMAICGLTFICLASMNLIQSWPRDRFQWASIFSRYAMGISMTLLLFLNLGGTQSYVESTDAGLNGRAAVFRWIDASWVLPTLALAYAIQFIIDTALVYVSVWHTKRLAARGSRA